MYNNNMAETLGSILKNHQPSKEPVEFIIIRKYVQDRFEVTPKLSVSKNCIKIGVPNAFIATNLRYELYDLNQLLDTKLRLIIKIIH